MDAVAGGGEGGDKSGFFCPSDFFLSPYFSEYTNDEPLKTNFRFIDPTPSPYQKKKQNKKQTKNKSHFGAVSPETYSSVAYSIWGLKLSYYLP